jgi:hypothetical protein
MSNTEFLDTGAPSCTCADPDVDRLRSLVAAGRDQVEASRLIWGGPGAVVGRDLALVAAGREGRHVVRQALAAAFPWLRLPPSTEPEVS